MIQLVEPVSKIRCDCPGARPASLNCRLLGACCGRQLASRAAGQGPALPLQLLLRATYEPHPLNRTAGTGGYNYLYDCEIQRIFSQVCYIEGCD
jgi:hypothetical protein